MSTTFHIATVDLRGCRQSRTRTAEKLPTNAAFVRVIAELSGRTQKSLSCRKVHGGRQALADGEVVGTLRVVPSGSTQHDPSQGLENIPNMT